MIAAVDNHGCVYTALTQVNTDQDVFMMFVEHLAEKLTQECKKWQSSTYFLLDGAGYHRAAETLARMRALGMNTIIAAPYAFLGAPVEMVFGYLKQEDLNPDNLPTGKR